MTPRINKRQVARAMLIAALDRLEHGELVRDATTLTIAKVAGGCPACGWHFNIGETIVLATYPEIGNSMWVHFTCPNVWDLVAQIQEEADPFIIVREAIGRKTAAGCGHWADGEPIFLVRKPVSLREPNHSMWVCKRCTKGIVHD